MDKIAESLSRLAPRQRKRIKRDLLSESCLTEIIAARHRHVSWKDIASDLKANGVLISHATLADEMTIRFPDEDLGQGKRKTSVRARGKSPAKSAGRKPIKP